MALFGNIFRRACVNTIRTSSLNIHPGISVVSVTFRFKSQQARSQVGETPSKHEELERLGLKQYMKKYRQYAQYNYEEWRYPQKKRAIDISCTRDIADPFKVNEGNTNLLTSPRKKLLETKDDIMSNRILKKRVPEFHRKRFPAEAQEIYIEAHNLLNTENWKVVEKTKTEDRLSKLVTEHANADMVNGLSSKTVQWNYIETIEPPRVMKVRCPNLLIEDNYFAQVTVRFHSKQTLAIYDRFGRLMYGSNSEPRNVLEYVVFERHISHPYGLWRVHAKIPANQYREPARRTVAVMKPNVQRSDSKAWHNKEEKECDFKWYPRRHYIMLKARKIRRRGQSYWKARRKYNVLKVKRTRKPQMPSKQQTMVRNKMKRVWSMRRRGELPSPPREQETSGDFNIPPRTGFKTT